MRSLIKYIDEALFSSASEFSKADTDDDFVDLGLSVKWSKCNLGAKEETDDGHYYMWGSTKPNETSDCCYKKMPFNNGSSYFDEEYFYSIKNEVCPNEILAPEYDVAFQESNGDYRMPTLKEFNELLIKTDHEWVENYDNNVNGIKFINKKDKNKYIFIPCNNFRNGLHTVKSHNIKLWTSDHVHGRWEDHAFILDCNKLKCQISASYRYFGFPIRPVKKINI